LPWSICISRAARPAFRLQCAWATAAFPCLFVSGKAPDTMPDLALGCLEKPFTAEDVHQQPQHGRGFDARARRPCSQAARHLLLCDAVNDDDDGAPPGFIPSRRSLKTRLEHWIAGHQQ
jgi:hypothetical protein